MIRRFCDRCGRETMTLSSPVSAFGQNGRLDDPQICRECALELREIYRAWMKGATK